MIKLETLVPTFDSSTTILTLCQIEAFVTTSDTPAAERCSQDGVEESTKIAIAAVGLPFNFQIDDATAGYPGALQAARLGLGRFNNPTLLQMRGRTTEESYRTYLESLHTIASVQRAKLSSS